MKYGGLTISYIRWHYSLGMQEYLGNWTNFIWFLYHFFSLPLLLHTLTAPWRRLDEHRKVGFHMEALFELVMANTIIRLIGILLRLFMIISGILAIAIGLVIGFLFFIVWSLLPFLVLILIAFGVIFPFIP